MRRLGDRAVSGRVRVLGQRRDGLARVRSSAAMELAWPPREAGGEAYQILLPLERNTARHLGILKLLNRGEMTVGERRIGERPQMFRWLEFGRIRRQKEQVDVVWHPCTLGAVPTGPIQHEDNLLVGTGSYCLGKGGKFHLEEGHTHRCGHVKDRATGGGMDEADQVAPLVAVLDRSQGALSVNTPDLHTEGSSLSLKGEIAYRTVDVEKLCRVAPGGHGRRRPLPDFWATSLVHKLRGALVHLIQG